MPMSLRSCLLAALLLAGAAGLGTAADAPKPYPLKTCIVSGDDLDADATVKTYQGQEMRFCCKKCVKKFEADPEKYRKQLDEAAKKKEAAGGK
jgi:YHS domain-containing protein